ncbi:hypothetical protein Bbelb_210050 [Branchiostoma belcheri]|nr:hypothetical protein Bbelb_210050 [Branchiostoma belcheri]
MRGTPKNAWLKALTRSSNDSIQALTPRQARSTPSGSPSAAARVPGTSRGTTGLRSRASTYTVRYTTERPYNNGKSGTLKARGRPRKTWIESVKDNLTRYDMPVTIASRLDVGRQLSLPTTPQTVEVEGSS